MKRHPVLACAALVIALAGCAPEAPAPSPSPTNGGPTDSPSPTATPSPTPTPDPLMIVDCEIMLPIAEARALFGDATEFLGERPPTENGGWFPLAEIDSTLAESPQARACTWGVPNSDGVFVVHAVEVTAAQRTSLEAALVAADFSTSATGTVTTLEKTGENELGTIAATHLFTGPLWIMVNSNDLSTTGPVANAVLDGLRAANPTLGL